MGKLEAVLRAYFLLNQEGSNDDTAEDLGLTLSTKVNPDTVTYQTCLNVMHDNAALYGVIDELDAQIIQLRKQVARGMPALMLSNIITHETEQTSHKLLPLSQLEVVISTFLSTISQQPKRFEDLKTSPKSVHMLHEKENRAIHIFPYMQFEILDVQFVLSAYISDNKITMWCFDKDKYAQAMSLVFPNGLSNYQLRNGRIEERNKQSEAERLNLETELYSVRRFLRLTTRTLSEAAPPHEEDSQGVCHLRCKKAAKLFIDDTIRKFATELFGIKQHTNRADFEGINHYLQHVKILDLKPNGVYLEPNEPFNYDLDVDVKPHLLETIVN